ncbi:unnamed protein product [Diplocarpon coronariae]
MLQTVLRDVGSTDNAGRAPGPRLHGDTSLAGCNPVVMGGGHAATALGSTGTPPEQSLGQGAVFEELFSSSEAKRGLGQKGLKQVADSIGIPLEGRRWM